MDMRLRVWREKVMLVMHLRQLGEGTLASQVYREQVEKGWPGLAKEAKTICENLAIEDCNETMLNSKDFKKILKEALKKKDEEMLRQQATDKSKCDHIMKGAYGKKEYMGKEKLSDVQLQFKSRVRMMPFGGNYTNDRRFARTNWMCRCKLEKESESHLKDGKCPVYSDIREDYGNLEDDSSLASFFSKILERRDLVDRLEEEQEEEDGGIPALAVGQISADVCQSAAALRPV